MNNIFRNLMQSFKIKRNGAIINEECYGNYGSKNNTMTFEYDADIKKGDIVLDTHSSYVITDIKTHAAKSFPKEMWHLEAVIIPEHEYNKKQQYSTNTINLTQCSINGAVQNSGTINIQSQFSLDDIKNLIEQKGQEDKERLNELIEELRNAENFEIYKKGMLTKFSDLLAKHSWLTGAIAQYIVPMLFNLK